MGYLVNNDQYICKNQAVVCTRIGREKVQWRKTTSRPFIRLKQKYFTTKCIRSLTH